MGSNYSGFFVKDAPFGAEIYDFIDNEKYDIVSVQQSEIERWGDYVIMSRFGNNLSIVGWSMLEKILHKGKEFEFITERFEDFSILFVDHYDFNNTHRFLYFEDGRVSEEGVFDLDDYVQKKEKELGRELTEEEIDNNLWDWIDSEGLYDNVVSKINKIRKEKFGVGGYDEGEDSDSVKYYRVSAKGKKAPTNNLSDSTTEVLDFISSQFSESQNPGLPDENSKKFVTIVNKKIESGKLINAIGHSTLGLATKLLISDICPIDYFDKNGGMHGPVSHFPYIALKADNSNQIKQVRDECINRGIEFSDFSETMSIGTTIEQLSATSQLSNDEYNYYCITIFGNVDEINDFTRKFSLFK